MQALFALKKIAPTFAGGRPSFCRPHFFICANCGGRRLYLNGKKKSREIRQLKIFWNFKEI